MAIRYPSPVIVSFGEESFFLDRDMRGLSNDPDRFIVRVDGSDLEGDHELVSLCETNGLDAQPRLVVVDNAQKVKPEKAMKAFIEGLDPKSTFAVLLLVVRDGKLPAFWAKASEAIVTRREHKKLKTFESNNEVVKFIEEEARKASLKIDSKVANIIYHATGSNLYRVVNEIGKLRILVGDKDPVTVQHLQMLLTVSSGADVWAVVDSAANRDVRGAMNALSSLYKHSPDDPAIPLTYALMRQVERMLVACSLLEKKASEEEIATRIGMHPFRCRSFFLPLARKHSVRSLSEQMQRLCKLDVEIKRAAGPSKRSLVELAVLNLAR
jgi:DNA polymerase-3 subunit delta